MEYQIKDKKCSKCDNDASYIAKYMGRELKVCDKHMTEYKYNYENASTFLVVYERYK